MQQELCGVPCLMLEAVPTPRRGVSFTRSFTEAIVNKGDMMAAVATFTTRAAEKLRRAGFAAGAMAVFLGTGHYDSDRHFNSVLVELPVPTGDTAELIGHATAAVGRLFQAGRRYKRAGVMFTELVPAGHQQTSLFDGRNRQKSQALMHLLDSTNTRLGAGKLGFAVASSPERWLAPPRMRSPRFTTSWDEIATVKV